MYAQNSVTTLEYEELLEAGHLPVKKGLLVDDDDLLRAQVIQSLMCYDQLRFDDFDARTGIGFRDYFAEELAQLTPLAQDDLVAVDDGAIRITPKGRLLLRNIAMKFDRYLRDSQHDNRYSKAI
jgi:oxygen-independent coproporphyrinogen-3 oxidase